MGRMSKWVYIDTFHWDHIDPCMNTAVLPADDSRIGRYSHLELAAMRGRRGRKPPEFYQLFPELRKESSVPDASTTSEQLEQPESKRVPKGARKADALAERIRAAPAAVRQIILAMLDFAEASTGTAQAAPEAISVLTPMPQNIVIASASTAPVLQDPVYADPMAEVRGSHEEVGIENDLEPEVSLAV
jgi:hypothetical protein